MSDDTPRPADETQPVRPGDPTPPAAAAPASDAALPPAPAAAPTAGDAVAPAPVARRGLRERFSTLRSSDGDRRFGLAALIASALAGIIVGGLGATAIHAVGDDHGRGDWMDRHGPMGRDGDDDFGGRGPMFGGPGQLPGQVQPTTPPDDDDSAG